MEASSPIAALHRPNPLGAPWGGRDIFRSHSHVAFSNPSSATSSYGLREQIHKPNPDYFNVKDVRGSSPAASLAADLSQNFRLDNEASPQFPTPRRALFTTNLFGTIESREYTTTPPLPPSSPAPLTELMEMSPLPHKIPASSSMAAVIEVTSPTPLSTPADEDDIMLDSPAPISRQSSRQSSLEPPTKTSLAERKIAAPRRPSLSRMKNFNTTQAVPGRVSSENLLSTFRFGSETKFGLESSQMSLGDIFDTASPPQERRPHSANSPCAPVPLGIRPRPPFPSRNHQHGPAINPHNRRQSNPFVRNRKQFRRSLSMFEHPADVMKPRSEPEESTSAALQAVMDVEEAHEPSLPHFQSDDPADTIPRIKKETLLEVLDGKYAENFDQRMIIDCRFEYEYDGGHIEGAVNYNDKEQLSNSLFKEGPTGRTLLIFHCEYSAHRAPLMARHIRSHDRTTNAEHYPRLTFPEVYILEGGYSAFFADHRGRCFPPEYVEMADEKHQRTCEREMGRLKARKAFSRAQTFAFGQRELSVHDSPTGPSRPHSRHAAPIAMIGNSPILGERSHARRMASY